jgi:hypothetical protein
VLIPAGKITRRTSRCIIEGSCAKGKIPLPRSLDVRTTVLPNGEKLWLTPEVIQRNQSILARLKTIPDGPSGTGILFLGRPSLRASHFHPSGSGPSTTVLERSTATGKDLVVNTRRNTNFLWGWRPSAAVLRC